jgi:hypothetical protein
MGKQRRRACRRAVQQRKEAASKAVVAKVEAPKIVEAPKVEAPKIVEAPKAEKPVAVKPVVVVAEEVKVAPVRTKKPAKGLAKKAKAPEKKGRFRKKKEE